MRFVLALLVACSSTKSSAPPPFRPTLGWRADLGTFRVTHATALNNGDVLLGATFNPQTTLPDMVAVDELSADFIVLGKDGAQKTKFRVAGGQLKALGHVGERVVAAVMRPGWQVVMLDLDLAAGKSTRETPLLTTQDAPRVAFATQRDGFAILLGEFDGKADKSTVVGYGSDGKERWRRTFPYEVTRIVDLGDGELAVLEHRGDGLFGGRTIDATGKDHEAHEVKLVDPDPYMSRGAFEQVVRDGDKIVWFGEAGGSVQVDGKLDKRTNTPAEPFALTGQELVDLDPGNGFIAGAGRFNGHTVVVSWINTSDATKGVYATAWDQTRYRLPIYEYTTDANGDNETAVSGSSIQVDEVVTTPTGLVLLGRCSKAGCAQEIH